MRKNVVLGTVETAIPRAPRQEQGNLTFSDEVVSAVKPYKTTEYAKTPAGYPLKLSRKSHGNMYGLVAISKIGIVDEDETMFTAIGFMDLDPEW